MYLYLYPSVSVSVSICIVLSWIQSIHLSNLEFEMKSVADPGFPIGGCAPIKGGMDLQRGHFLVKMYVKRKELGPIGGMHCTCPPRSANVKLNNLSICIVSVSICISICIHLYLYLYPSALYYGYNHGNNLSTHQIWSST